MFEEGIQQQQRARFFHDPLGLVDILDVFDNVMHMLDSHSSVDMFVFMSVVVTVGVSVRMFVV